MMAARHSFFGKSCALGGFLVAFVTIILIVVGGLD